MKERKDTKTAQAFATSWNNLPKGSTYTYDQFVDWLSPLTEKDIKGKRVLELGCGNASLMMWLSTWEPSYLEGVDLGDSILSAKANMKLTHLENYKILQEDLTKYRSKEKFDNVYCIGVLHHLKDPFKGFEAVVENTRASGNFHCWVYAKEGNNFVISVVDPLRKVVSKLPWWATKYLIATPLALFFYLYTTFIKAFATKGFASKMPMYSYALWISKRGYFFHRHVAFDQLVTPQTTYLSKEDIKGWLDKVPQINKTSVYIINRNGNSWKFGGKVN